jgi:hypothetical protein
LVRCPQYRELVRLGMGCAVRWVSETRYGMSRVVSECDVARCPQYRELVRRGKVSAVP